MLETGDVLILFSLPQLKKLGITNEPDPKGDKITCPFEYSTTGHIV